MARVSKRSKAVIDKNVKAAEAKAPVNAAEVKEAVEVKTEEVKEEIEEECDLDLLDRNGIQSSKKSSL